jgi:hypothetical protein
MLRESRIMSPCSHTGSRIAKAEAFYQALVPVNWTYGWEVTIALKH